MCILGCEEEIRLVKRKYLLGLCASITATALILGGCSGKNKDTEADNAIIEIDEVSDVDDKGADEEADAEADASKEQEADNKEDEESRVFDTTSEIVNNNGHFVMVDDKIYFHVVDADAMGKTSLWGNYADSECGRTILYEYDPETGELNIKDYDYASGIIAVNGSDMYYYGYKENGEDIDSFISGYSLKNDKRMDKSITGIKSILGASEDGRYLLVLDYDYWNNENEGVKLQLFSDGELNSEYNIEKYCSNVKVGENDVFFIQGSTETGYELMDLNIISGEMTDLGELPTFEYSEWAGYVDQCILTDDAIYFTYSLYEGTGNFFAEGYYVKAEIGMEASLSYADMPPMDQEGYAPFAVKDGEMVKAEGVPGSCGTNEDGELGYYDEDGKFIAVIEGFGYENLSEDGDHRTTEIAEKIGDSIYVIYNDNARAPEDDVGWRYAYYRKHADYYRIDIKTGKLTELVKQVGPMGE